VERTADDFLRIVLPTVGRMRENAAVLSQYARSQDHINAARDLLQDLCNSIRGFGHVGLPQLLGPAEPMPIDPDGDRAWLSDVAFSLHDLLIRCDMVWPPPELQKPPAIVRDLQSMYAQLAFRHKYLLPVNAETLMNVVSPVGEKACKLARSDRWFITASLPANGATKRSVFDPACQAAGFTGLRPHDLRHTAASLAIQSGANVKVVQQMLGHASAAMTLDVYAGLFGDDLDSVAERLDSLVPQMRHEAQNEPVDLAAVRASKVPLTRRNTSVGPVGLEPTTYGEVGVHRLPWVLPVAKRALPGSERATCD
jgi:hypothetical protein